jgi:hypothetical protein
MPWFPRMVPGDAAACEHARARVMRRLPIGPVPGDAPARDMADQEELRWLSW